MLKRICIILLLIVSLCMVFACNKNGEMEASNIEETTVEEDMDNKMPNISCETNKGNRFELYERKNDKPAFINFWATWCGPCVNEMPALQELYAQYKEKVDFIFVNCGDSREIINSFLMEEDHDYSFPIGYDETGEIFASFGFVGIPTTIIVDKDNNVSDVLVGARSGEEYKSYIEKVFAK